MGVMGQLKIHVASIETPKPGLGDAQKEIHVPCSLPQSLWRGRRGSITWPSPSPTWPRPSRSTRPRWASPATAGSGWRINRSRWRFLERGRGGFELICPFTADSGVARFLEKRGEGLHHICVTVPDLEKALAEMKAQGLPLIDEKPRPGAGGLLIAFVHPKGARGVLMELKQAGTGNP